MSQNLLPAEFAALEPFAAAWSLPDHASRYKARLERPFAELVEFHDAIMPLGQNILTYLDARDLASLTEQERVLGRLMLSLSIVALAVEIFGQNRVPDTESTGVRLLKEYVF